MGSSVSVSLFRSDEEGVFPAIVTFSGKGRLGVKFDNLSLHQQAELASLTFARADAWIATWGTGQRDKPLRSLKSVIVIGLRGIGQLTATAFKSLKPR
jgi:cellulose synthase (UDP-forming)